MPNNITSGGYYMTDSLTDIHGSLAEPAKVRTFPGGATRDLADHKPDYHRFLCPKVLTYYCEQFMMPKQETAAGRREADNWKSGFGKDVIMASLSRHYWSIWRKWDAHEMDGDETLQELSALLFNCMAMMRELMEEQSV